MHHPAAGILPTQNRTSSPLIVPVSPLESIDRKVTTDRSQGPVDKGRTSRSMKKNGASEMTSPSMNVAASINPNALSCDEIAFNQTDRGGGNLFRSTPAAQRRHRPNFFHLVLG